MYIEETTQNDQLLKRPIKKRSKFKRTIEDYEEIAQLVYLENAIQLKLFMKIANKFPKNMFLNNLRKIETQWWQVRSDLENMMFKEIPHDRATQKATLPNGKDMLDVFYGRPDESFLVLFTSRTQDILKSTEFEWEEIQGKEVRRFIIEVESKQSLESSRHAYIQALRQWKE